MKAYECGKETEHHFTARFISDPKEHPLASSDNFLAKMPESVIVDLVQSNWPVEKKLSARCRIAMLLLMQCA